MKPNYTYNVIQESEKKEILQSYQTTDRKSAVKIAKELIFKNPKTVVYISFYDLDDEFYYVNVEDITKRIIKWRKSEV